MVCSVNQPTSMAQFGGLQSQAEGEKLSQELSLKYRGVDFGAHIFKIVARTFGVILISKSEQAYIRVYEDVQTDYSLFARFQLTVLPSVAGRQAGVIQFQYGGSELETKGHTH